MITLAIRWISLCAIVLSIAARAGATPITYTFSGTLEQPFDGSTQFSGIFTYDTDLTPNTSIPPFRDTAYYTAVPLNPSEPLASLTFTIGNTTSSSLGTVANVGVSVLDQPPGGNDAFEISEQFMPPSGSGNGQAAYTASIAFMSNNPAQGGPFTSTNLPTSLNLTDFSFIHQLEFFSGSSYEILDVGKVTSLGGETIAPEPASILVFGILGAGVLVYRGVRLSTRVMAAAGSRGRM